METGFCPTCGAVTPLPGMFCVRCMSPDPVPLREVLAAIAAALVVCAAMVWMLG